MRTWTSLWATERTWITPDKYLRTTEISRKLKFTRIADGETTKCYIDATESHIMAGYWNFNFDGGSIISIRIYAAQSVYIEMFKVSQEIYLAESDSANHSKTFGVYQQSQQDDSYGDTVKTFVDPCVTQADKVSVLHWPEDNISLNQPVEFVIRKNGARGNVNVKLVNVKNQSKDLDLVVLDPDRYLCRFTPIELGIQKMRVYFNTVEIPSSPFPFYVRDTPLTE